MRKLRGRMLNLKNEQNQTRFMASTPEFKQTVRDNRGHFTAVRKMIDSEYSRLLNGATITDKALGITLSPATTGPNKGANNLIALRIDAFGKSYFLKEDLSNPKSIIKRYAKAERAIRVLGNTYRGFNLKVIKPHFIYSKRRPDSTVSRTILVTDFFDASKVALVEDYKGKDFRDLRVAIEELGNKFSALDIHESSGINSFYDEATKTIYLFDV